MTTGTPIAAERPFIRSLLHRETRSGSERPAASRADHEHSAMNSPRAADVCSRVSVTPAGRLPGAGLGVGTWACRPTSSWMMGVKVGIVVTGVVLGACSGDEVVSSSSSLRSTSDPATTTSTLHEVTAPADMEIEGRLPDGRGYRVSFSPRFVGEEPEGVFAGIVINLDEVEPSLDGEKCASPCTPVLGITTFHRRTGQGPTYVNGAYGASSGDWTMTIAVYQHIIEAWGDDIGELLLGSIAPIEVDGGLPAFELSGPLRWATDDEIPLQMEVSYPSFVVRRGCEPSNVGCSPSASVQVIPTDVVYAPAPVWDHNREVIVSDAP